jgi:hypothetical protein
MTGPEPGGPGSGEWTSPSAPAQQHVDLVGPHLRVAGRLAFGRFTNLVDLINHNRSHLVLYESRLLDRSGTPTDLVLPELIVNPDDITFVGHPDGDTRANQTEPGPSPGREGSDGGHDRPGMDKLVRHVLIFTPGHAITGGLHLFREMTLANFVEATDPRFIPVTDAVARSLTDPQAVNRFALLLVNRTQISAIAEAHDGEGAITTAIQASLDGRAR